MLFQDGVATMATMVVIVSGLNPMVEIVYEQETELLSRPVSSKLVVNKTGRVESGAPFMMSCSLPDQGHSEIELCTWRREGLSEMFVQESGLFDYRRNKVQGISVVRSDEK